MNMSVTEYLRFMIPNFILQAPFVARALCKFDPQALIETFSNRVGVRYPFNKETCNLLCALCTLILAARNTDDIRRMVREQIR